MPRSDFRRYIRRRAVMDALAVVLTAFAVSQPVANPHDSLLVGIAAVALGILFFVVRRNRDLEAFVAAGRHRQQALEGGGISLAQWHGGKPLLPWQQRRTMPTTPAE